MLSYTEALELVLKHTSLSGSESILLEEASGRFLVDSPRSRVDLPPFLTSSVDGYAIRLPSPSTLEVSGEMPAGSELVPHEIMDGHTVQVFTGSPLPANSSAVVMVEDVQRDGNLISIDRLPELGENLRLKGEEMTIGQELVGAGIRITPPVLALLANSGNSEIRVAKQVKVAIVEIGSELQNPGETLRPGAIYSANGLALSEGCKSLGARTKLFRSSDDYTEMEKTLDQALDFGDVVLTSGGVSVGKHDHVKAIWAERGVEEIFWRVAIRPGRPLYFGKKSGKSIFGLPGNPVSTLVTFFLFVRPALVKMQGGKTQSWTKLKSATRLASAPNVDIFLRVRMEKGVAWPLSQQGSHMLSGLANADALLRIPRGELAIGVGATLPALVLDWNN